MIFRHLPDSRFSEVSRAWAGRTVAILGCGASLTREQVERVASARARAYDRVRVIAINDAYLLAPWADILYFADAQWFKWHRDGIDKPALRLAADRVRDTFAKFSGEKCSIETSAAPIDDEHVHILRRAGRDGWSTDAGAVFTGGHGGFQALQIAALAGASHAILLGFDARPGHFHGEHPRAEPRSVYPQMVQAYRSARRSIAATGFTVINCTAGSAIDAFDEMDLADALRARAEACV